MEKQIVQAAAGKAPFDLAICGLRLLNVFTGEVIFPADIGIVGDTIAYAGLFEPEHRAKKTIDAKGLFAIPGLVDGHMHLESSMMTPAHFAEAIIPMGTTTVVADPHEIGNAMGKEGVKMLIAMTRDLPLRVHIMAPSTIPSLPGYETSGADITGEDIAELLSLPGVHGVGEIMDFLGVVAGEPKMMAILAAAKKVNALIDGHVPTLRGKELQAFTAAGIFMDHTYMDADLVKEKLGNGMRVQIQERFLTAQLMASLNSSPAQDRIMLVTDDVPISRLASKGHLSAILRQAIALGLDPIKAIRYATLNSAEGLRLYDVGALSPGRKADILLVSSLEKLEVQQVYIGGRLVAQDRQILEPISGSPIPAAAYHTMKLPQLTAADFIIAAPGEQVTVNAIEQDGKTSRTRRVRRTCAVEKGVLQQGNLVKMAVFERYTGKAGRSLGLLANLEDFRGALATTYAHDCHNLVVFSQNDSDGLLAANTLIAAGGGVAAVLDGKVLCAIPLPIAGILCEDDMAALAEKFAALDRAAQAMGLNHAETLTFLTLMALAVSPEIKLTDKGLIDVVRKEWIALIEEDMHEDTVQA